jgi:AsmA-like protein
MSLSRWLRAILVVAVVLIALSWVFSLALRASAARRYLTAHLTASFGRPVDVSRFDFSLLDGGRIEGHSVTVAEDPRFGNEYFLRSDTLAAGLRWSALLAGQFEFGSVSLSRPSLNLVRNADGEWNIERWLPPPAPANRPGFVGPVAPAARAVRPARIDIDDGRINFKRGDEKIPFALVGVSGRIEQSGAGRWQLDLEARPMRAGVELQDIGTMRLRGSVAGTTARLQPADLALTWRAASLADTLRLITQNDYGLRGELAVDLSARIAPSSAEGAAAGAMEKPGAPPNGAQWSVAGVARLTGLHGWALPERQSDPAANLSIEMDWRLGEPRAQVRKLTLEMPASRLEGHGDVDWARGVHPELQVVSSTLGFSDILSCYRALHHDVAEDLRASGSLSLDLKLADWPFSLQDGAISSAGGTLTATALPAALRVGAFRANLAHGKIDLSPTEIGFLPAPATGGDRAGQAASAAENAFMVRGSIAPSAGAAFHGPLNWSVSIEGETSRIQDWLALAGTIAQPVNSGWTASGGVAVKIRGESADSSASPWIGTADFLGLTLNPSYVNQGLVFPRAHVEFTPAQRTVTLASAQAFGTSWRGSITRKYSDQRWSFDLTADALDAPDLDRWLGPRARPGFLARMIGFESAPASAGPLADAPVTRLAAQGRLRVAAISVPPMRIEKFDGQVEIAGRAIRIRSAQGDFFGGKVSGSLDAQLVPDPSYEFEGRFDRVDLALLARSVPTLSGRIGGTASATLALSAHGVGRQDLIDSMEGQGTLNGRNVSLRGLELSGAGADFAASALPNLFASLQGTYHVRNKSIDFVDVALENSEGGLAADGRVDFSHALNIRIHPSSVEPASPPPAHSPPSFLLGGTIEAPDLFLASAAPKPSAHARQ